jgi:hypothetical protein
LPVSVGKKITVTREQLVDFVLQTIEEINHKNEHQRFIADAFIKCGLNPWGAGKSLEAFDNHLSKLESNEILRAMITNQTALELK